MSISAQQVDTQYLWGGQRYSHLLQGDQLRELIGMNPLNDDSIDLSISEVTDKAVKSIPAFLEGNLAKEIELTGVGLKNIFKYPDGKVVWLWEVKFEHNPKNNGGAFYKVSFYVTNNGNVILPKMIEKKIE